MDLIAKQSFTYDNRRLKAGDVFSCSTTHAGLLIAIGRADEAPPPVPVKFVDWPAEPKPKRRYRRRDMVEES